MNQQVNNKLKEKNTNHKMNKKQFKAPIITNYETDPEANEIAFEKLKTAEALFSFTKHADAEYQAYFSGLGEEEFAMLLIILGKHPALFEFLKAAIVNTELYKLDGLLGFQYSASIIDYINRQSFE